MADLNGTLFVDLNGNGIADEDAPLIPLVGWTVYVDYNDNGELDDGEIYGVTDANGQYSLSGIVDGTYKVRTIAPPDSSWIVSIPDSPTDEYGTYRVVDFQATGNVINGVNFENANNENPPPVLQDNSALTAGDNQKWSSLGFKFWLDNDKDFIPDVEPGEDGGTMFVEERAGAERRTQAETELSAFVNDRLAGDFGDLNRLNRNGQVIYDVEDPTRYPTAADGLGQYFLRGGGLYAPNNKTIPTLLIEYTTPTSAASGWIWDIDTTWREQNEGKYEQWRVAAFDANKNAIDIDPNSDKTYIDSPIGESAWLLQNDVWVDNPNSLDGRHWEWSFTRAQADVRYVQISYIGTKGRGALNTPDSPEFVGLAFDRFQAFGPDEDTADFGAYQPATIGDYVWKDGNGNGIQDDGEAAAVAGVTVSLLDASGNPVRDSNNNPITTTTDANGKYSFNVAPGTYSVQFSNLPTGFTFTTDNVNDNGNDNEDSDALDSGADPVTGRTGTVTVESGEINNTLDAGLVPKPPQVLPASIGNFVWADTNGNGIQDDGESGIDGVTVRLLNSTGNTIIATQTTSNGGAYLFSGLNPGDYIVEFVKPNTGYTGFTPVDAGGNDALDSDANVLTGRTGLINLSSGENDLTVDAGLVPPPPPTQYKLGDKVWSDTDQDGLQDTGEAGIDGITVRLLDSTGTTVLQTTTTQNGGLYSFTVNNGTTYRVEFAPSTNTYGFTQANIGGNDGIDSDADVLTGRTGTVTINNADNLTVDAGLYRRPTSLAGYTIGGYGLKNKNGAERVANAGYSYTSNYETVFGLVPPPALPSINAALRNDIINDYNPGNNSVVEFAETLDVRGNSTSENLLRQSTAALLNASATARGTLGSSSSGYYFSIAEVIAYTRSALSTTGYSDDNQYATWFDNANNGKNPYTGV
jgi:hypothetical protein